MPPTVHGLVPILATPFHGDGSLDVTSLRRLTEFQLESGVDGIAVFGMASESFALTASERATILDTVIDVVGGAVPVVAGVNGTSTVTAVEQAQEAASGGADALMVLPPFLVTPGPDQLIDFYRDVASTTGLEVMVQDAPAVTGVSMTPSLIVELSKLDGVTSVKVEAPPTAPKVSAVVDALGDNEFAVLGGQNAQFCLDEYSRGAVGTMPACEFPDLLKPVLEAHLRADVRTAHADFARLLPLILFGLQSGLAWAVHKEVMLWRGLITDATVRAPARALDTASRTSLHAILDDLGL
ncbi:dihydrodipicolinate synthase family protein [Actinobacteria bacterium YIM 96077]|uniref:Dihydrodipicolinate synthase family protein n=1 Tax=Phytoactinopolyspora halophila TaxID=1981511 RepID=A0A329QBA2_9ACTN|nr:dihydrodipicolinate synthase family protein [Phytoactinopolyspora halophila]AYY13049.1 dihydrodipicolinate synthase family protein [Actinobacteria bacterium YIM 96077]RAW09690.1 dihydrodipicolinate synthase family protein [Phytoactinopolyspora halophila]